MRRAWPHGIFAAAGAICACMIGISSVRAQQPLEPGFLPDDPIARIASSDEIVPRTPAQLNRADYFRGQGRPIVLGQRRIRGIIDWVYIPDYVPPDPVCDAEAAFIGLAKARRVFMNSKGDGLFTEVDFAVEAMMRGESRSVITVATEGGAVKIGNQSVTADLVPEGPLFDYSLVFADLVPRVDGLIVGAWGWIKNDALEWVSIGGMVPSGSSTRSIPEIANAVRSRLAQCPRR